MKRNEASDFFRGVLLIVVGGLLMLYALGIELA
jgi:hypothetical protein